MSRIALIGSQAQWSLEHHYANGLRRLGHEVTVFDPDAAIPRWFQGRALARLTWRMRARPTGRALVDFFQRDARWDAVVVFKGLFLPAHAIARCRELTARARWANLNPDNSLARSRTSSSAHVRASISLYDHHFVWSSDLIPRMRSAGARSVSYLPFGWAEECHVPSTQREPALSQTVSFVGTFDRARARTLEHVADLPLRVYGGHWERLPPWFKLRRCIAGDQQHGEALQRIVGSSLATINILREQNTGAHNMRTFEVPAMRGVLLTTRSEAQHAYFPEGSASLMFDSPRELRQRFLALLSGTYDVEAMRERAFQLSRGHSYTDRARELVAPWLG